MPAPTHVHALTRARSQALTTEEALAQLLADSGSQSGAAWAAERAALLRRARTLWAWRRRRGGGAAGERRCRWRAAGGESEMYWKE